MKNRTCRVAWPMIGLALMVIQSLAQLTYEPYTFTTLAGYARFGSGDGTGRYRGVIGEVQEETLGANSTGFANKRFTFTIRSPE